MKPYGIYGIRRWPTEILQAELAAFVLFQTVLACTLTGKLAEAADLLQGCLDYSEESLQREMGGRSRRRVARTEPGGSSENDCLRSGLSYDRVG